MSTCSEINESLGKKLKKARQERRLTREELSEKIDVSSRFLASVESGQVGISLHTLKKICIEFGISADELLGITSISNNDRLFEDAITRIKQLPPELLPPLLEIITSYTKAISYAKDKTGI